MGIANRQAVDKVRREWREILLATKVHNGL